LGTLLAVVAYFLKDWLRMAREGLTRGTRTPDGRLFWFLAAASIPGALAGVLLEEHAATVFRSPLMIAAALAGMALVLLAADRLAAGRTAEAGTTLGRSLAVGVSQALAVVPGVSRSGITMAAGLFAGMTREQAARFSFLLSTPMIAGAGLYELRHIPLSAMGTPFIAGIATSAVSGFLVIAALLAWLRRRGFLPFVIYRLALAAAIVALSLAR